MRVVLASASPRRREILARITHPFDVRPADLDESRRDDETPHEYVVRLAAEKAAAVAATDRSALVIGADTAVALDDLVLGKPAGPADAARMLATLSGRRHRVLSGVAIARQGEVVRRFATTSEVRFRALQDEEIARYVATGEPLDKAGAYAVQGGAAKFVLGVDGSVTGVIGLPLEETRAALREVGLPEDPGPLPPEVAALRFRAVEGEVAARAVACGREIGSVRLVTVTKGHDAAMVRSVVEAGAADIGENYVQEARAKREVVGGSVRWHLIGPLQRNKARLAAEIFDVVHTIDRVETATALSRRVPEGAPPRSVLVQVNVDRDPAKAGIPPEELERLLSRLAPVPGIAVSGLMTIGREGTDAGASFAELRELRDRMRERGHEGLVELSMGMSHDYDAAIEQGATLVRLGTAVLGPRPGRRGAYSEGRV